jgi:hypothetical protein
MNQLHAEGSYTTKAKGSRKNSLKKADDKATTSKD